MRLTALGGFAAPFTRPCVTIRVCEADDLRALEWDGLFSDHRDVIEAAFRRQGDGTNIMLVAECAGRLVGQVWIDLENGTDGTALLWALRVHPSSQRCGIGSALLHAAERCLGSRGYCSAVIGVDRRNEAARRLSERAGYRVLESIEETYRYTAPGGVPIRITIEEWLMAKRLYTTETVQ